VGSASTRPIIREIEMTNTTAVAVSLRLCSLSTAGTPGTSLTVTAFATESGPAVGALRNTYSGTAPTTADMGKRILLPGVIGAGVIWTFNEPGLAIPKIAAAGIGVIVESGTGQAILFDVTWDE
jgi:hypothetical protein